MMRGRVEPSTMLIVAHVVRQTAHIPQMPIPQETQLRDQKLNYNKRHLHRRNS
jgi:hypothetical protein